MIAERVSGGAALAALLVAGCGQTSEPLRPGLCVSPAAPTIAELARVPEGLSSLSPVGESLVFSERRTTPSGGPTYFIRRMSRDGAAVDLAPLGERAWDSRLLPTAEAVFWSAEGYDPVIRRAELKVVPLTGGPVRSLGVARLDWSDDVTAGSPAVVPLAADERTLYFRSGRYGSRGRDERIFAMSRADGSLTMLAHRFREPTDVQLVGGHLWWTERSRDEQVLRVSTVGAPNVESFPVEYCERLLVTADQGFFCGGLGRLTAYDSNGRGAQVLIDIRGGDKASTILPFAHDGEWLWLHEDDPGNVRRLHLATQRLEDVVCARVEQTPVLTAADLVWTERMGNDPLVPAVVLQRQPR